MIMITPENLEEKRACWFDNGQESGAELYREATGTLDQISLVDALQLDTVTNADKVWLASVYLTKKSARLFACDCADRALGRIDSPDPRSVNAVSVARSYANGQATDDELSAARYAALDAARGAAWYAALSAAWDAAGSAAWDAARCAALNVETEWQVKRALHYARQES